MRNKLYKLIIENATDHCYRNCLDYFPENAAVLDVGIGNGVMMENYHSLIKSKGLKITGIDINEHYIHHCECIIDNHQLSNHVEIYCEPVEHYNPCNGKPFDFILFSMSFMLFENQSLVLDRIKDWVKPGSKVLFFQTMFKKKSRLINIIKPKLKYFTTIDFGRATYENDFFGLLEEKKLSISEDRLIQKKWYGGEYRMIVTSFGN